MSSTASWTDRFVTVDPAALFRYAGQLAAMDLTAPDWRMPVYPADDAEFVQFIGVQNALNFCFTDPVTGGKFAVELDGIPWAGATGLCAALMRARSEGIDVLDVEVLAKLDVATARHVFRSDEAPITLLAERVALLNSLAASLARYDGSFATLFEVCGFDAGKIISTLVAEFPAYAGDVWLHPVSKMAIPFDKRARLLPLMYEGRARASEVLPTLVNVWGIGPVIDYQLPRALREAGVLVYTDALAGPVDAGELLAPGSEAELAIRFVTHDVAALLVDEINALVASPVSMVEVDFALWAAGRKAGGRHHLTLTTAY